MHMKKSHLETVPSEKAATCAAETTEAKLGTRERILKAAEELFAMHGYAGTSLRSVMAAAGVDNGAIYYHFKTKLGLLQALFEARVSPVNEKREQMLSELEALSKGKALSIKEVLYAFIAPALLQASVPEAAAFNRVTALCSVDPDPDVRQVVFDAYNEVGRRFAKLLRNAAPPMSDQSFHWCLECMYGAMMYIRSDNGRVSNMLDASHRQQPPETVIQQLVDFVSAGFFAHASTSQAK